MSFNLDGVKNKNKKLKFKMAERIDLLVNTIKEELVKDYEQFVVKIIQLYYDDDYLEYKVIKEEDITKLVCV